jgi:ABC-type Fe3+/spermidine/putrescine transport system ATPase subunit
MTRPTELTLLQCRSLQKSFEPGKSAVSDVSLDIGEGEIVSLLGPSGCGKTTLLRIIAGLEEPDRGEVWFDGRDMAAVPPHRRDFGMMFQDFALFPHKNVFENIAFGLRMHGGSPASVEQRANEMLRLVELAGFGQREVDQLSGGEQQRVALARALAPRPRLLMLDEPLGALDRQLRERLMLDLRTILKKVGVTALYVTHDQLEAFAVSDRVAVMNQGQIEQVASPETVYKAPATPFVARFLGFQNVILATVSGAHTVETSFGQMQVAQSLPETGSTVTLLIRPGAARLLHANGDDDGYEIISEIKAISFRGKYYQAWVQVAEQTLMFEMSKLPGALGERVHLILDPEAISVFPS